LTASLNETLKTVMKRRVTQTMGNLRANVAVCSTVLRCTGWLFGYEMWTDSPGPVQYEVAWLYNDGYLTQQGKISAKSEYRLLCFWFLVY